MAYQSIGPTPTPYLYPSQGGNKYILPGSETQSVSQNAFPIASVPGGGVRFSSGAVVPSYNTTTPGYKENSRTVQNALFGANMTQLGPVPVPVPTPERPQEPSKPSIEDQQRSAYFSELDRQANLLPETQRGLESQVNNLFNSQSSTINTDLQGTLGNLDLSNKNITSNKVTSLRDLDQDMRNQLQAGNVYLGSRGAGDSSAANQFSYALSKVGSQNRTAVLKQANELYAQVDNQINQAKATAQDQLQQLETWKNNNLIQISQYIQSLRGNIDSARANFIQSKLSELDQQTNTYKNMIAQWIVEKGNSLSQIQQQLKQLGVGPTVAFSSPKLPGMSFGGNLPSTEGTLFGKKTDEY